MLFADLRIFLGNEKNFQEGDFLNFPVLELAKEKFGGTMSKDTKLSNQAAQELLESLKTNTMNE